MTLALATSLVECGRVDAAHVSAKYAEFYESWRGYGGAAHRVMRLLQDGGDYRGTGRLQFPEGSFGNGGAMRIAPVGLAYRHATDDVLLEAVEDALVYTRPSRGRRTEGRRHRLKPLSRSRAEQCDEGCSRSKSPPYRIARFHCGNMAV